METLDLDINNYELNDILELFKIGSDFGEPELKSAKQIVLKMHPDKSRLDKKYFLFFSEAYKVLFNIYTFKNKSEKKNMNDYGDIASDTEERKNALNSFFTKNKDLKTPNNFNKWFNEQFEKSKVSTESDRAGYGDWLQSDEDINEDQVSNQSQMAEAFAKKKAEARALVVHKGINESYFNAPGASNLTGEAPQDYSSDLFSSLNYQDLRQAHKESVIPVTEEDYHKVLKFQSVTDYESYRNSQKIVPLSEAQAMEYLKKRDKKMDNESSRRAFELAKQTEEATKKNNNFWGSINKITNF